MNYAPHVISYLSSSEDIAELYLVPGTYIMEKRGGRLLKASDVLLTPEDVRETLIALKSYAHSFPGALGREGMFSFGLQRVGRFRVKYMTQRGSYVVHIIKTPYQIPPLEKLCPDRKVQKQFDEFMRLLQSGVFVFQGKNPLLVSTLVYSLLQEVCSSYSKVLLILEAPLSFLLRHGQSVVIQREVGMDVDSFEEGLKDALYLSPHILYMGHRELLTAVEVEYITRLAESTLVILNLSVSDRQLLESIRPLLRAWAYVGSEPDGTLTVTFKDIAPEVSESR